jgi:RNA polymerase-binding protein DksA
MTAKKLAFGFGRKEPGEEDLGGHEQSPTLQERKAQLQKELMIIQRLEEMISAKPSQLLDKIDEAILRIDEGSYGICDDCGEEIRIKRLEARPVAKFCIDCKIKQEQREKAQGR